MHKGASNVTVFPGATVTPSQAAEHSYPSIILVTPDEHDEASVRHILGDSCQLTSCSSLRDFNALVKAQRDTPPQLVLVRDLLLHKNPKLLQGVKRCAPRHTPLLVLSEKAVKKRMTDDRQGGARDTVSFDQEERLRAVVHRELDEQRLRRAYQCAAKLASRYRRQLERLHQPTADNDVRETRAPAQVHDRDRFMQQFASRLANPPERGVRALAWIRPDNFLAVQKAVGVLRSEDTLAHIAAVLRELLHPSDICGRIGGIVFAVYIERGTMHEVEAWLKQFCRTLAQRPFVNTGNSVRLTCTAGLSEITNSDFSADRIFEEAHEACRCGRLQGENQVYLSANSKSARSVRLSEKKWASRIQVALKKDRFQLVHSPVVSLDGSDDKIRDTWVRMIDSKGNTIQAAEFVPVARRLGLMLHIDRWVAAATMTYCTKRKPDLVFVRLSEHSMLDDSLAQWLAKIFENSSVEASQICFQTTEAVASRHLKKIVQQVNGLAAVGFQFAIEKIGATPDTMDVLQFVPMQYARIDAALLQRVAWDKAIQHRVCKLVRTAKAQGIHTVADRVEDAATMAALCQMEVEFMQGDYVRRDSIVMEDTMTFCRPALPPINKS